MGRELKRVPLDFAWPMDERWHGYLNPHYEECKTCGGSGSTVAKRRLDDLVSLLMLSGSDAARGKCHPYLEEAPLYETRSMTCGQDMVELTSALAGRSSSFMGYDSVARWSATRKIIAAAGLPEKWGTCLGCDGHGIPRDKYEAYEAWSRSDPPTGEGFQIWETVSEGSPISPVFATAEELARHMATTSWGADHGTSYEQWLRFINGPGWAPSMMYSPEHGLQNGVSAVTGG